MSVILPAIFFGHGNPMNALLDNAYTEGMAPDRTGHVAPARDRLDFGALVCPGHGRDHQYGAADHS